MTLHVLRLTLSCMESKGKDAGAALAAATPWKVVYFDAPTRGEQLRILLVVAGVPFVDERVKIGGLAELQHATLGDASPLMFDQCPMVVSPDGTTVAQTAACMQFVGRQTDLAPKDPDMDARAMALTLGSEVRGYYHSINNDYHSINHDHHGPR